MLFVDCWLLFVVCCSLFVVLCLLFVVGLFDRLVVWLCGCLVLGCWLFVVVVCCWLLVHGSRFLVLFLIFVLGSRFLCLCFCVCSFVVWSLVLVFGPWSLVFGVCCYLLFGVWCLVCVVCCVFNVRCLLFAFRLFVVC